MRCAYDKWVPAHKVYSYNLLDDISMPRPPGAGTRMLWVYLCEQHNEPWIGTTGMGSRLSTLVLVAAKRMAAFQVDASGPTEELDTRTPRTPTTGYAKKWVFTVTKSESRFWKSFHQSSQRIHTIHNRALAPPPTGR